MIAGSDRIIVALDTRSVEQALHWVQHLEGAVGAYKVGLEFLSANGPDGVRAVAKAGAERIFIDGKYSDIPNTVAGAVRSICAVKPWMLNVHALSGMAAMRAAKDAAAEAASELGIQKPLVIAVTVLTSLDQEALAQTGIGGGLEDQVVRLALLAQQAGLEGVVASPREIDAVRIACGGKFLIVTPGIRPSGGAKHDQLRTDTPAGAINTGADYIVVGRSITAAPDPRAAAIQIAQEIFSAV